MDLSVVKAHGLRNENRQPHILFDVENSPQSGSYPICSVSCSLWKRQPANKKSHLRVARKRMCQQWMLVTRKMVLSVIAVGFGYNWGKMRNAPTIKIAGWWFGTFFIFPYIGNNHPNWLIFFRGVQTTNQIGFFGLGYVMRLARVGCFKHDLLSHCFQLIYNRCMGPSMLLGSSTQAVCSGPSCGFREATSSGCVMLCQGWWSRYIASVNIYKPFLCPSCLGSRGHINKNFRSLNGGSVPCKTTCYGEIPWNLALGLIKMGDTSNFGGHCILRC